jgi:uncharacterized delta-60 repeat protein
MGSSATSFGTVLPGASAITSGDCHLVFGSSNDSSMLRTYQTDQAGKALWREPDGPLDTSFNGDSGTGHGITTKLFNTPDSVRVVAPIPGGKSIVELADGGGRNILVYRINADGSTDNSFGVTPPDTLLTARDGGMAVQPDGKIVVSGPSPGGFSVTRLKSDGTIDTGFATAGTYTFDLGALSYEEMDAIAISPIDGSIYVGGGHEFNAGNDCEWAVVRLTSAGALDTTFSGGDATPGYDIHNWGATYSAINAAMVQPDGKLVVVGNNAGETEIERYTTTGAPDTTFNGVGWVDDSPTPGGKNYPNTAALLSNGDVAIAGAYDPTWSGNLQHYVELVKPNSAFDTTFNTTGWEGYDLTAGNDYATSVVPTPDGTAIWVAGVAQSGGHDAFSVQRFLMTGAYDTTFSQDGQDVISVDATHANEGNAAAINTDGKLLVGGKSFDGTNTSAALVQYNTTQITDYSLGSADWSTGSNMFGACLKDVLSGASTGAGPSPAATWVANAGCTTGGSWNAIPTLSTNTGTKIAQTTVTGTVGAVADLRFGIRTSNTQVAGNYAAPITFEVDAPDV